MLWLAILLISALHVRGAHVRPGNDDAMQTLLAMAPGERGVFRSFSPGVWIMEHAAIADLRRRGVRLDVENEQAELDRVRTLRARAAAGDADPYLGYTTHEQLLARLDAVAAVHGTTFSLGRSVEGREIRGVLLRAPGPPRPLLAYMGPVHGNEIVGRELLARLLHELASVAAPEMLRLVDLAIVPTLNPDGVHAHTRGNADGIDLNRAFPDRCDNWADVRPTPETAAIARFVREFAPTAFVWFHGGAEVMSVPYDAYCGRQGLHTPGAYASAPGPEYALQQAAAHAYAIMNARMTMFDDGTTNGAKWYSLNGGAPDWAQHASNRTLISLTAEVSARKLPAYADFDRIYWPANRNALLQFPRVLARGVFGTVRGERGELLPNARVWALAGHTAALPTSETHLPIVPDAARGGYFARPLPVGPATIIVAAEGYVGVRIFVDVADGTRVEHDFALVGLAPGREHAPDGMHPDLPYVE